MKKTIITLLLMLGIASASMAQSSDASTRSGRWGVRLSYELACPGDVKLDKSLKGEVFGNGSGFSLGAVYTLPVIYNFYFEPGVSLYYNTYSMNTDWINDAFASDPELAGIKVSDASVRMWGLRIPLLGGYRFDLLDDISLSVFTGPEVALGLSAKSHMKLASLTLTESEYGDDGSLNRADVKWRFGVGATLSDRFHVSLSGAVGMCDQFKDAPSMHSNLFDITVGYNF